MDLNKHGTYLQNKLYNDAYRKLRRILKNIDIPLDFTKPLSENEYEIEQAFKPAYAFILSFLESVALTSINFSRMQLREINKKVTIKRTEIEITVQWDKVDQDVLNFLQRGDSFSNPYFDLVTQAIATGNRNRLTDEYIAYVRGEKTLQEAYNFLRGGLSDDYRANLIVRGEMTQVWAIAQQESYRTAGTIRNAWNTRNDGPKVCPICAPLNGLEAIIGEPFAGTRITRPSAHAGCILPGNVVNAPFGIDAMAKSFYDGLAIEITISDGRKFSVTKNHPILTSQGWIAAYLLCEGMNVISAIDSQWVSSTVNPDDYYIPSQVEEIFNSFIKRNPNTGTTMPAAPENFHGDGESIKGNINIIPSNGLLLRERNCQHTAQDILDFRHNAFGFLFRTGLLDSFLFGNKSTLSTDMGVSNKVFPFVNSGLLPTNDHRIATTSLAIPNSSKLINDVFPTALEFDGKLIDGQTTFMQTDQFVDIGRIENGFTLSAQGNAMIGQSTADSLLTDTVLLSKFFSSHSSQVTVSNIVNIRHFNFTGHVFDLQSDMYQLYICNGIIVKNCRCWLSPVPMTDEEIEEFIKKGSTEKVKIQDKRKKKEKVSSVQTPTVTEIPKPTTIEEFRKAFEEIEKEKYRKYERFVEQEIAAQKALNKTSKNNFKAIKEYDKAVRNGSDEKTLSALEQKKKEVYDIHDKQIKTFSEIKRQKDDLDKWSLEEQRKLIYADKPANQKVNFKDNDVSTNVVRRGLAEFNKLIPESFFFGLKDSIDVSASSFDVTNSAKLGLDRSWYHPNQDTVYFGRMNETRTVIHEFVHWLEFKYTSINDKAVQFLDRRTVGESSVKLNVLFPNNGYADTEETKIDKFEHPYMGKSYNQSVGRTTEILSMGIDSIWQHPKKFLDIDEDYFTFIMRDILGKIK